jgi:hypothetical protein
LPCPSHADPDPVSVDPAGIPWTGLAPFAGRDRFDPGETAFLRLATALHHDGAIRAAGTGITLAAELQVSGQIPGALSKLYQPKKS